MKRIQWCGLVAVAAVACSDADVSVSSSYVTGAGNYLVVFRSETLPGDAGARIGRAGGTVRRSLGTVGLVAVRGDEAFAARIARDSAVLAVGREHMMTLSPTQTTAVEAAGHAASGDEFSFLQWDMRRIGATSLWGRTLPASSVAVLDTGVMDDHPDLAGNVCVSKATNWCRSTGGPSNTPGYPIFDQIIDFDTGDICAPVEPVFHFHGTHVSGTIAAKLDGVGVVGVSPTTCIAAYKVFDRYRFHDQDGNLIDDVGAWDFPIFEAIVDATLTGHKVINMSLGGGLDRSTRDGNTAYLAWDRVAKWANRNGTLIVAAAGNDTTNNNGSIAFIPSDLPTVMSTSATGSSQLAWGDDGFVATPGSDVLTFYSNFGAAVDIAAPGGDCGPGFLTGGDCDPVHLIPSTCIDAFSGEANWCWAAGTSMAAPHVAAVAGVVRALHPTWTPGATRSWLKDTAQSVGGRQGFGAGLVDAARATR